MPVLNSYSHILFTADALLEIGIAMISAVFVG
jgi:hypothetical protein